jgi:hypothetical protein
MSEVDLVHVLEHVRALLTAVVHQTGMVMLTWDDLRSAGWHAAPTLTYLIHVQAQGVTLQPVATPPTPRGVGPARTTVRPLRPTPGSYARGRRAPRGGARRV